MRMLLEDVLWDVSVGAWACRLQHLGKRKEFAQMRTVRVFLDDMQTDCAVQQGNNSAAVAEFLKVTR